MWSYVPLENGTFTSFHMIISDDPIWLHENYHNFTYSQAILYPPSEGWSSCNIKLLRYCKYNLSIFCQLVTLDDHQNSCSWDLYILYPHTIQTPTMYRHFGNKSANKIIVTHIHPHADTHRIRILHRFHTCSGKESKRLAYKRSFLCMC